MYDAYYYDLEIIREVRARRALERKLAKLDGEISARRWQSFGAGVAEPVEHFMSDAFDAYEEFRQEKENWY